MNYKEALDLVKDALHQHKEQKYDEPAVMCYEAMKKQMPEAPVNKEEYDGSSNLTFVEKYRGKCPRCDARIGSNSKYCPDCGQRIDWEGCVE